MLLGIRHTGLIVSDLSKSKNFYENILGFEVIQDFEDDSDYINTITATSGALVKMVKIKSPDQSVIELLSYEGDIEPTTREDVPIYNVGEAHIAIQVSNAEDFYSHLAQHNIKVLSEPVLSSEGFAKVFFCIDPDNYRVEVVEIID
jgi:catechol 2,3-dioxygenase-like lactoylglutathione lyase family enzyme